MNDPHDTNSPHEDDLDRTRARPGRRDDGGPADDSEAERTMRRRPSPDAAEPDATLARPGRNRPAGKTPPADGTRLRRPDGSDGTRVRPRQTAGDRAESGGEATIRRGKERRDADPLIGKVLGGCRIDAKLGEGGMGTVYRARQLDLDRDVAIKTIRPEHAADEDSLKRFQREARAVGKFRTQHIVQVYQVGNEQGIPFIVLEYLAGGSLADYAERQPEQRIAADDAIRFLREASLALSDAADKGVVHRDIKPDNLLLDEHDVVKIADFGISKMVAQDVSMTLTMGGIIGTPMYMSPEQCRGDEIDFRSDMWSLGATFFYLLTGKPPAKGSSLLELIQTKNKVRNLDPSKILPDEIPGPLSQIIRRLTMLDPAARYASYDELLSELDAVDTGRRLGGGKLLATLARWSMAFVVLGGGGYAGYHYRAEIQAWVESLTHQDPALPAQMGLFQEQLDTLERDLAAAADRVHLDDLGNRTRELRASVVQERSSPGNEPFTADFDSVLTRVDGIRVEVLSRSVDLDETAYEAAESIEQLDEVSMSLGAARTGLGEVPVPDQAAPLAIHASEVRRRINGLEESLGLKKLAIEEAQKRLAIETKLGEISTRVLAAEDLAAQIDALDDLLGKMGAGGNWDELRDRATALRIDAKVRRFDARITALEEEFRANGPVGVRSKAQGLVGELDQETASGFEALKARASDLDIDARNVEQLQREIATPPVVSYPFEGIGAWVEQIRNKAAAAKQAAKTESLAVWADRSIESRLTNEETRTKIGQTLTEKWRECVATKEAEEAQKAADPRHVIDVASTAAQSAVMTRAIANLATLPDFDPNSFAPPDARRAITEWITSHEGRKELIERIRQAIEEQRSTGTLAQWLSVRDNADATRKSLAAKAEGDREIGELVEQLDATIGFWRSVATTAEGTLADLGAGRLGAAIQKLRFAGITDPPVPPLQIPEIDTLHKAVTAIDTGYEALLVRLEPDTATRSLRDAQTELLRLPESIGNSASVKSRLDRVVARIEELANATQDMAPVVGGLARISTPQKVFDGDHDVGSFFIDRTEVSRRSFLQALDASRLASIPPDELRDLAARRSEWTDYPDEPANGISRAAAAGFLRSQHKDLPTYAEWWLAIKGKGQTTAFPWGARFLDGHVELRSRPTTVTGGPSQLRVGTKELFHAIGNAAEWLADDLPDSGGTSGLLAGGGFGEPQRELIEAASGEVNRASLVQPPPTNAGCRGVLRPQRFLGDLAPTDRSYPRKE